MARSLRPRGVLHWPSGSPKTCPLFRVSTGTGSTFLVLKEAKNLQKLKERPACSWKWHVLSRPQAKSCKTCTQLPRQPINACRLTGRQVHSGVSTSHRWFGIRRTQVQEVKRNDAIICKQTQNRENKQNKLLLYARILKI